MAIKKFHSSGPTNLKTLQNVDEPSQTPYMPKSNINKLPDARGCSGPSTSSNMRISTLFTVAYLLLCLTLIHAKNLSQPSYPKRGAHPFPLPSCPTGARLCDFFNGAYCFNPSVGDSCCGDGSGE